jgi:hypothetical protein
MSVLERRRDDYRLAVDEQQLRQIGIDFDTLYLAWNLVSTPRLKLGQPLRETVELGRNVGRTTVIRAPQITPTTKTRFMRRIDSLHPDPSRIVKHEGIIPFTRHLTILGDWNPNEEHWDMRTVYPGPYIYPQPWDFLGLTKANVSLARSMQYWCMVAYVWNVKDFYTRITEDTWAGLVDRAAPRYPEHIITQVGYSKLSMQWQSVG